MCPHESNPGSKFYPGCIREVAERVDGEPIESISDYDREQLAAARQAPGDGDGDTVYQCQICPARYTVAKSAGKFVITGSNKLVKETPNEE
jgi:hypothetical protein